MSPVSCLAYFSLFFQEWPPPEGEARRPGMTCGVKIRTTSDCWVLEVAELLAELAKGWGHWLGDAVGYAVVGEFGGTTCGYFVINRVLLRWGETGNKKATPKPTS